MTAGAESPAVEPIAIVGLACRVPGAQNPRELWQNLRAGVDSITRFEPAELLASGVSAETLADPDYVPAAGLLEAADEFDAEFFGFNASEAETLDPQHRLLFETAWAAVEDSGHDPARLGGAVGVFAGAFMNKYLLTNLSTNPRFLRSPMAPLARMLNDKDFLATRIAYLLDLTGPAYTVQTACSTSLVATHLACQSLLSYESDAAIVGGVTINVPLKSGYPVAESGLFSADGHCRPFDVHAAGTVPGNGVTAVVLRRLSDAVADRDHVYAVVRSTAVNNDGTMKAGFAAPSVDGQARVIATAHALAEVDPATIGYLEAHGTATQVGDPIEVAALKLAFGNTPRGRCALGSVKANIGHLDAAAGLAGLIRAALALHNGEIPPSANFTVPNPELRLEGTPFYVPTTVANWPAAATPRRAGVSSFGVGGTNAHAILEQAPATVAPMPARGWQLLTLSARTPASLDQACARLADHLAGDTAPSALADVAFTLQEGRRAFRVRRFAVCSDTSDAVRTLRSGAGTVTATASQGPRVAVFAFPGGGTQHPNMGLDIYRSESAYREAVDTCSQILEPQLGFDLRRLLFPAAFTPLPGRQLRGGQATMGREQGAGVVSALFVAEYALAMQLMAWGIHPDAMIGHSLGEYVAACLSGVFSLADALEITLARGELFTKMEPGRMLTVALPAADVEPLLPERISVAALNSPDLTVVAGPDDDIAALLLDLRSRGVDCRKLSVPVASHSWMVEPYLEGFAARVGALRLGEPSVPFISSVTGTWITPEQATDAGYWVSHLREPVRFASGVRELLSRPDRVVLEVGPGKALSALTASQRIAPAPVAIPTMGMSRDLLPDLAHLLSAVGRLWQAGVPVDWEAFHGETAPRRVSLPTYPFERRRYWIEPGARAVDTGELDVPIDTASSADSAVSTADTRTPREREISRLWCDLLGRPSVGLDEDFFDLGGHSLMLTQLTRELRRMGATALSVADVLQAPTVAEMAALVDRVTAGSPAHAAGPAGPPLEEDAHLDEAITADGLEPLSSAEATDVLLTGATGFVGAFLCAELLASTTATVHCLVRAADEHAGRQRLLARFDSLGLTGAHGPRLRVVVGDLAKPLLGVSQDDFDSLASRIDAVYHCGAWVNFVRPYRALKATNVRGTEEVLRFATTRRLKPVHHISTLAVLAGAVAAGTAMVGEDDPLPAPVGHDTAYSQSKWVAERLVDIARSRGVPVSVYRAGGVLADSRSGATNVDDYVTKVIQGCVQLGLAPTRRYRLSVGTVDHLARLVVALSQRPAALGRTFHVIDPTPLDWNEIFERIRQFGLPVRSVAFDQWRAALVDHVDLDGDDNALAPLMAMLGETADRDMPVMSCANVERVLGRHAAAAPPLDSSYFRQMLEFLVRGGLLPPAPSIRPVGA